jgi:putative transposase
MPRKKTILQSQFPYHVTARSINKEFFYLEQKKLWRIFCDYLFILKYEFSISIHSFVLMDNHFHMIVSTPLANLSKGMNYFIREVSREVSRENKRINQTFGGPYHWCILDSYKYVYRNPVDAGITNNCEDYFYSSLHGLIGQSHLMIPIEEDTVLFNGDLQQNLMWLNFAKQKDVEIVRKSLKKPYFRFGRSSSIKMNRIDENFIF